MRCSIILLAAGLSQTLAQSWNDFGDLTHALAARDLLYDGALRGLYARAPEPEPYFEDDDELAFDPLVARALARRSPMYKGLSGKKVIQGAAFANDVKNKAEDYSKQQNQPPPPEQYPDTGKKYDDTKKYSKSSSGGKGGKGGKR